MKHWRRKAGVLLLCFALLLSNQNLLLTSATETNETVTENRQETVAPEAEDAQGGASSEEGEGKKSESEGGEVSADTAGTNDASESGDTAESGDTTGSDSTTTSDSVTGKDDTTETGDTGAEGVEDGADSEGDTVDGAVIEPKADEVPKTESDTTVEDLTGKDSAESKDTTEETTGSVIVDPALESTVKADDLPEGMSVVAEVPAEAFDKSVELKAKILNKEDSDAKDALNTVSAAIANDQQSIGGAFVVDISFEDEDGEEKEPSKAVIVTVQADHVDIGVPEDASVVSNGTAVYHVVGKNEDMKAVKVKGGEISLDDKNQLVEMRFETNSFSPFVAVVVDEPVTLEAEVCSIGTREYATLDEAIAAAADGETIYVLADCKTEGMELYKDIDIVGIKDDNGKRPVVTFADKGIALWGHALTFKDCEVVMNAIGSTPYTAEWNWMTICASKDASLTLNNVTMTMDGDPDETGINMDKHAIYFCSNNKLNLINNSTLIIKNYKQDALEWDGGDGGYNINITGSTFISDHNRSGFTGTLYATIMNSKVSVINSLGNGSNGTNFYITNNSNVKFNKNTSHGLSATNLTIDHSVVEANENGMCGILATAKAEIKNGSTVTVRENDVAVTTDSRWARPGAFTLKGESTISEDSTVTIADNKGCGIYLWGNAASLTMESGTVQRNKAVKTGKGGGIYNEGTCIISDAVQLYNNHAGTEGDDIYNADSAIVWNSTLNNGKGANETISVDAVITFGEVGTDWSLDGDPDCTDKIDGWYDDAANARWKAHGTKPYHVQKFTDFSGEGIAQEAGTLALKAAHGLIPIKPDDLENPDAAEWTRSKSKTATNLDKNFDSEVTLSLPAADYKPEIDVVFIIDDTHAGKDIFTEPATKLLEELRSKNNLSVNLSIVTFDAVARDWIKVTSDGAYSGLVSINDVDGYKAITTALAEELDKTKDGQQKKVGGTNLEWPLEMAGDILTQGSGTEKHVILFSDMYGYIYRGDLKIGDTTYKNVPLSTRNGKDDNGLRLGALWQGVKYNNFADVWDNYSEESGLTPDGFFRDSSWSAYWENYTSVTPIPENTISEDYNVTSYPSFYSGFEKSTCLTYSGVLQLAQDARVTIVNNDFIPESGNLGLNIQSIKNGMLNKLSGQGIRVIKTKESPNADEINGVFTSVKNQLIQLVDAGSRVEDVIGYGVDDKGNEYDFDFVNDMERMTLTVGGIPQDKTKIDENYYGFGTAKEGEYPFELHYYENGKNGKSDECFVLEINVAITVDEPVQLTYAVHLTNPQSEVGSYGKYDFNGEQNDGTTGSLFTNLSATLWPVDSTGEQGMPEEFRKPTVSYTITKDQPPKEDEDKPQDPGSDPEPEIPSDPEPVAVVKQPTITTPAAPVVPEAPATGETAAGAATGDDSPVAVWLVIAMAAMAAVVGLAVSKKRNSGRKNG